MNTAAAATREHAATRPAKARPTRSPWNRKNPYPATLIENNLLSHPHSDKEVRHFAFALADSGLTYEAGDGLNVRPVNDPSLVAALLERLGLPADAPITARDGSTMSLEHVLTYNYEISTPSRDLIDEVAIRTADPEIGHVLATGERAAVEAWLWGKDVLDVLAIDPTLELAADEFVGLLTPLQHRTYSISSSPLVHEGVVHTTVASVRYRHAERTRGGCCSTYLADRVGEGTTAGVFIAKNNGFRLPADDSAPIVMIGPGTGIAPFRAFLHERQARGAAGRNWLFFGDRRRATDFIYEDDLNSLAADGVLTRLDLAFSRDQAEKIYVQHRMRENGRDLFAWLQEGAYVYVCGDALRMAKDVDQTLREIVAEHGGLSPDAADEYVASLRAEKRYLKDVY
ncbi:sulfite reductase subunit alpha [Antrihabitans sp. YC2-6]|nr:sulfite reductase subunit alpha [Antrihabitans sp. YC2-6]